MEQRLTFDEMMNVKLYSAVYPQMMQNNAGKQFSRDRYRKTLWKVCSCYFQETILKQF